MRYQENRNEVGRIRSFFRAFRKDERIDGKIQKNIQREILDMNKMKRQEEKEKLKVQIHNKMTSEFNEKREALKGFSLGEKQSYFELELAQRFPEYKDEILGLSEEMKKYEKEIAEYDKKFEEARDGKKSEKEPKDTKTTEEHDEPEV